MYKLLILVLALMIAVTLTTIPSFGSDRGPGYQCRNIGKQKVKPYKFKKAKKAKRNSKAAVVHAVPKFRPSYYSHNE